MATLHDNRTRLLKAARLLAEKAKAEGRDLTPAEIEDINTKTAEIQVLNEKIQGAKTTTDLLNSLGGPDTNLGAKMNRRTYRKSDTSTVRDVAAKMGRVIVGEKAADLGISTGPAGYSVGPELLDPQPVMLDGNNIPFLSQVIARRTLHTNSYEYLRQTTRDNKAAVVPLGELKPTSTYGFQEVRGELFILAHLSEPFHKFWTVDHPELIGAVAEEMLLGLFGAEEQLLLHGSGTAGQPTGVFNTEGIITVPAAGDLLTTTRKAVSALEANRYSPYVYAMHPQDWERIELSRDGSGRLEFEEGPVNRAEKKLWSTPVAISTYLPKGTALLLAQDAVTILDRGKIDFEVSTTGDDFQRNQLRMRCEERMGLEVLRPNGIVKVTLDALPA